MGIRDCTTDATDLILARRCVRCDRPGRALCASCLEDLRGHVGRVSTLPQAPPAFAALPYDAGGRDLVVPYKEHGQRALAPMLGLLLADAVEAALRERGRASAILVPVPPHPRSERGFDPVGGILRFAVPAVRQRGFRVRVEHVVRATRGGGAMKTLDSHQRQQRAHSLFHARRRGWVLDHPLLVVDDVVTTGSTVAAMRDVLASTGAEVLAAAAVTGVRSARLG